MRIGENLPSCDEVCPAVGPWSCGAVRGFEHVQVSESPFQRGSQRDSTPVHAHRSPVCEIAPARSAVSDGACLQPSRMLCSAAAANRRIDTQVSSQIGLVLSTIYDDASARHPARTLGCQEGHDVRDFLRGTHSSPRDSLEHGTVQFRVVVLRLLPKAAGKLD